MKQSRKQQRSSLPSRRQTTSSRSREEQPPQHQFRRGRTLTGSSSGKFASGNELRADLLSPRAQSHHLSAHRRTIMWRLFALFVVALTTYVILSQLIAVVTIRSAVPSPSNQKIAYQKTLDDYFNSRPLQRFRPTLDESAMTQFLQASHPELKSATVRLSSGFGNAQLAVTFREPIARWTINGSNEYVDATGTVFKNNMFAGDMIEIVDNTGAAAPQSGIVASKRFLSFVGLIVGDMQTSGYQVAKATIPPLTTRQLSIQLRDVPYSFKLSTDRSAGEQSEDIARTIPYLQKKNLRPDYVDLRVKGKAFYK